MTIHVDTSALIDALAGPRRSIDSLIRLTTEGHRLAISAIVRYEWLRGPRTRQDLDAQEALFPSEGTVPFGPDEAALAAKLYKEVSRPRGREIDLAIAATALAHGAGLLTLNTEDFDDIPNLRLV